MNKYFTCFFIICFIMLSNIAFSADDAIFNSKQQELEQWIYIAKLESNGKPLETIKFELKY